MRASKLSTLRERLRKGADAFEFDALIEGVSTLDEPGSAAEPPPQVESAHAGPAAPSAADPALAPQPEASTEARPERISSVLDVLGTHLLAAAGGLRAAIRAGEPALAGHYLARANQLLDLLHTVDPTGDTARRLEVASAPPEGRTWPPTAWSIYEFAESPLSGLLPAEAPPGFVEAVLRAAWGLPSGGAADAD
ncbi:MAG: hypothetical protein IT208_17800 [Chthonomonadales bacterium]|nr:hypothetical protein [Chthonomonadales bacterium]